MIIYKITNLVDGKVYIGQTKESLDRRWKKHVNAALTGKETYLHKAIRKYGKVSFSREIIAECDDRDYLSFLEILFIQACSSSAPLGYNLTSGGYGGEPSEESREKMRTSRLGRKDSDKTKVRKSIAAKGKSKSKEHRSNISKGRKGIKFSEEHISKLRASHLGKKLSEEQKLKISESLSKAYREGRR